jgi:hypothetical protein
MKDIARHCPRRAAKVMLTKRSLPIRYCRRLHCRREVAEIVGIHVACDIEDVKISEDVSPKTLKQYAKRTWPKNILEAPASRRHTVESICSRTQVPTWCCQRAALSKRFAEETFPKRSTLSWRRRRAAHDRQQVGETSARTPLSPFPKSPLLNSGP